MDPYTRLTLAWLNVRYRDPHGFPLGTYFAHEPIYGLGVGEQEPSHARRIVRLYQLLRQVRTAGGRTLLDVGGAEGYFAQLCRELLGMEAVTVDLSSEACRRAAELFQLPACAVDSASLPFADASFDTVTCAEVIEHLAEAVPSVLELQRVCAGTVVLATEEWQESAAKRAEELAHRHGDVHGERNILADVDMKALFSPYPVDFERQVVPDLRLLGDDRKIDKGVLRKVLLSLPDKQASGPGTMGIVASIRKGAKRVPTPRVPSDEQIADLLIERRMPIHRLGKPTPVVPWPKQLRMICPGCQRVLQTESQGWSCTCGKRFERKDGVVSFVSSAAPFRNRVDAMLAARGGAAYPQQRDDLLALARQLEMPFDPRRQWDLTAGLPKGWRTNDHVKLEDGAFAITGVDPQIKSSWLGIELRDGAVVHVDLAVSSAQPKVLAEVFWFVEDDLFFVQDKSASVTFDADGKMRTHRFAVPQALAESNKLLLQIRIDPCSHAPATVRIEKVAIG